MDEKVLIDLEKIKTVLRKNNLLADISFLDDGFSVITITEIRTDLTKGIPSIWGTKDL